MATAKTTFIVVDEVEEDTFVLLIDDGPKIHLERNFLPEGTREGTVLRLTLEIDEEERGKREQEIGDLQERLLKRTRDRNK